jgi:hypothetical protein
MNVTTTNQMLNDDWCTQTPASVVVCDADGSRRFITDLDGSSIYALIGTASYYQAFALRDALYNHLAFENSIAVTFQVSMSSLLKHCPKCDWRVLIRSPLLQSDGLARFELAFHLPYYVWRGTQTANEDHRRDANANPLRQSRDVSFLNWNSPGSPGFLYEAQISCVVAGSDEWVWAAYCFVDTYFDAGDDARETVQSYYNDSLGDYGARMDPLTFGVIDADKSIQNPRTYFLTVFRIRIKQVKREWQQVVAKVQHSVREYEQVRFLCFLTSVWETRALWNHFKLQSTRRSAPATLRRQYLRLS